MKHFIGTLALTSDAARLELRRKVTTLALACRCSPVTVAVGVAHVSDTARDALRARRPEDACPIAEAVLEERDWKWQLVVSITGRDPVVFYLAHEAPANVALFDPDWLARQQSAFAEPSRETLMSELGSRNRELQEHRAKLEMTVEERTEELREAIVRADAANRTKGAFLAAMSHEIRTPMNAILNMVDTVLDTKLEPQQREFLSVADSSARHLLSLINDILDFSKIEAGRVDLEDIPFSLHRLIEEVGDMFRVKVGESEVELICGLDRGVPDGVRGDPSRLRQILVNLVGNAFKFTRKGEILLRASPSPGDKLGVRLEVRDTGVGIAPEHQSKLFQPFVQADSSTTRRYGGTGLGLSISRKLAQAMNGDISFTSSVGAGTTFYVDVPLKADLAGNREELTMPPALENGVILLVEPSITCRDALSQMFTLHGLKCVAFASVSRASEWLKQAARISAAIIGSHPKANRQHDLSAIAALRKAAQSPFPCLLATAFADRDLSEKAKAQGVAAFLPKPVSWAAARAGLATALNGDREVKTKASSDSPEPFAGKLALLAEDNPQNQLVAKIMLRKLGIAIDVAENGKIAVEMAKAAPKKYQVILMDVQMPEMDGLEATRRIRELSSETPELGTIPIVAMTASVMKSELMACIDAGMDGFIMKPIDKGTLLEELRKVLGTNQQ